MTLKVLSVNIEGPSATGYCVHVLRLPSDGHERNHDVITFNGFISLVVRQVKQSTHCIKPQNPLVAILFSVQCQQHCSWPLVRESQNVVLW